MNRWIRNNWRNGGRSDGWRRNGRKRNRWMRNGRMSNGWISDR